jgi:rare lipoprotein A
MSMLILFLSSCQTETPFPQSEINSKPFKQQNKQIVKASYYGEGDGFKGKKTASGEIFNPSALTAAHPTLPFDTMIEVRNPKNGKKVNVRINDRGTFTPGRSLDLSLAAAQNLEMTDHGVTSVEIVVIKSE